MSDASFKMSLYGTKVYVSYIWKKVFDIYNNPYILYEGTQTNHSSTKYQMTVHFSLFNILTCNKNEIENIPFFVVVIFHFYREHRQYNTITQQ